MYYILIDGFDELLSKDFSTDSTELRDVESMLNTILDLLVGNSRIIITSRKTAIFSSEEFNSLIDKIFSFKLFIFEIYSISLYFSMIIFLFSKSFVLVFEIYPFWS